MKFIVLGAALAVMLVILILRDQRKQQGQGRRSKRKVTPSLQEFLPIEGFHESGAVIVNGRFRRLIRVGDLNLYAMSMDEIVAVRERFKAMLMRLDNPFQISVQARRANYTDFVAYAESTIDESVKVYDNPAFTAYAEDLKTYLREEAMKPRTDRENLIVIGVLPKVGGEDEKLQLERLAREQSFVESGLSAMGLPYEVLEPVQVVEAVQNFWNRERAVSQRYRDAVRRRTHAPRVDGLDVEVSDLVRTQEEEGKEA
ncbi:MULTISPECIES: hypothetical protein [Alicyclobacillus]|uniref:Uncharacterized protein n=1 Tax=Alicyclobacillus acidocaldarius subsp. acidocaldarius (strain ATCC 27009 / DSM 446 / BCRC 14685 / JCM 5260 / KCTC 1825 / NBRC 15652 / NCIMB 11725 / NRRL B-14509 / 104-IA) TaxID=521098 RepID=C8WY83_ALIAD|nr:MULTISPECIES: hypothetical protein [Alicyclobacillus]ACV59977.1 hypothetical protein Aaci_2974 [Alicyclobacillus acidocaldarius subsp. acidocaldarius DSM 446]